MTGPDYVIKREGRFYYSRRVPSKLQGIIGREQWRESLGTSDATTARKLAASIDADHESEITAALLEHRRQRSLVARMTATDRQIVERAGGLDALRRQTIGVAKAAGDKPRFDEMGLRGELRLAADTEWFLSATTNPGRRQGVTPDQLEADLSDKLAMHGEDLDQLRTELAEASARASSLRERLHRNLAILKKDPTDTTDPEPIQPGADISVTALAEVFVNYKGLNEQHAGGYRYPIRLLEESKGGALPVRSITKADIRTFRDLLPKVPASPRPMFRSVPVLQAIARADRLDKTGNGPVARLTASTAGKHLSSLKTFLKWAVSEGYLEHSPAEGIEFASQKAKYSSEPKREGFDLSTRLALFAAIEAKWSPDHDYYWIPRISLFSGMRLEEIAQLYREDIREEAGVWFFDVTDTGDRRVKSRSSIRKVPVHPDLSGFLDRVKASDSLRVFSSLSPDGRGRMAGEYGQMFGKFLRRKAKITNPNLTFHSLRGTFKDICRDAGVPSDVSEKIMGHAYSGNKIAAAYGSGHSLPVLAEWMSRIKPFDDVGAGKSN